MARRLLRIPNFGFLGPASFLQGRVIMRAEIPVSIGRFLRLSAHLQMLPVLEGGEETLIGGQAVMEGVMMLAPHSYCVAVRKADGKIVTESQPVRKIADRY